MACSYECCGQPSVGRVGNKGVDINWDASSVSSPAMLLIHGGEVNKVNKDTILKPNKLKGDKVI